MAKNPRKDLKKAVTKGDLAGIERHGTVAGLDLEQVRGLQNQSTRIQRGYQPVWKRAKSAVIGGAVFAAVAAPFTTFGVHQFPAAIAHLETHRQIVAENAHDQMVSRQRGRIDYLREQMERELSSASWHEFGKKSEIKDRWAAQITPEERRLEELRAGRAKFVSEYPGYKAAWQATRTFRPSIDPTAMNGETFKYGAIGAGALGAAFGLRRLRDPRKKKSKKAVNKALKNRRQDKANRTAARKTAVQRKKRK